MSTGKLAKTRLGRMHEVMAGHVCLPEVLHPLALLKTQVKRS